MNSQQKFPKYIEAVLDIAFNNITRLPCDQWDEITEALIIRLKEEAEQKNPYHGLRYLADIKEDIEQIEETHTYTIVKRKQSLTCSLQC